MDTFLGATQGTWLSYGNAASAVGNVPGSLSAYIIGVPLIVWFSPWAPMLFLIFLHIASFFLFDSVIKQVFEQKIRLLFLILYWLNPWFLFENVLYNPSYLFFFVAIHFWSAFHMHQKKNFLYTCLHFLSIGLAMQLHYSWPILVIISSYLFYRGIIKIHWLGLACAITIILTSLIPYIQELLVNDNISKNSDPEAGKRYIGWGGIHVYPVLKAFLYWLRYGAFIFSDQITLGANFEWLPYNKEVQTIVMYIWRSCLYIIGGISLLFSLKANIDAWVKIKPLIFRASEQSELNREDWMLLYMVGTLLGVLISAILSPILFNHWHLIITYPIALFPVIFYINNWIKSKNNYFIKYLLFIIPYFIIINLIGSQDSEKFSYKVSYQAQVLEYK